LIITNHPPRSPPRAPIIKHAGKILRVGAVTYLNPNLRDDEFMLNIPVAPSLGRSQIALDIARENTANAQVTNTFQMV